MANKKRPESELNQKEFIQLLKKVQPDYHEYEYRDFMEAFVDALEKAIYEGKGVRLNRIGIFRVDTQAARIVRNPGTGETKMLPDRPKLRFIFANKFKNDFKKIMYKDIMNEADMAKS